MLDVSHWAVMARDRSGGMGIVATGGSCGVEGMRRIVSREGLRGLMWGGCVLSGVCGLRVSVGRGGVGETRGLGGFSAGEKSFWKSERRCFLAAFEGRPQSGHDVAYNTMSVNEEKENNVKGRVEDKKEGGRGFKRELRRST